MEEGRKEWREGEGRREERRDGRKKKGRERTGIDWGSSVISDHRSVKFYWNSRVETYQKAGETIPKGQEKEAYWHSGTLRRTRDLSILDFSPSPSRGVTEAQDWKDAFSPEGSIVNGSLAWTGFLSSSRWYHFFVWEMEALCGLAKNLTGSCLSCRVWQHNWFSGEDPRTLARGSERSRPT